MSAIWSNTDFPYMCLKDRVRTLAFRRAIHHVVRPGDVVVDAGAGTGILAFFAAEAGASNILAVEIDPLLAAQLKTSIELNGLTNTITVIEGDAREVPLPLDVDIVIAEIIDTGLMDEAQAQVIVALTDKGVITDRTSVIPECYTTFVELVSIDDVYYGFKIAAPKHEWPFYEYPETQWHETAISSLTDRVAVSHISFGDRIDPFVDTTVMLTGHQAGLANGIRISGHFRLSNGVELGPTNALNGDKIMHLPDMIPVQAGRLVPMRIQYRLGGGLGSFVGSLDTGPIVQAS